MAEENEQNQPNVFGHEFAGDGSAPDWLTDDLAEEAATPPAEPTTTQQEATPAEAPAEQQPESEAPAPAEGAQQSESDDQTQTAPPAAEGEQGTPKLAGRYDKVEDLEKGYLGISREKARFESRAARAEAEAARYRQALEQAAPYLQQAAGQQQPGQQAPTFDPNDPASVQAYIDQRLAQGQQTIQQQAMQQAQTATIQQAAEEFMTAHPDVEPDSELDLAIGEVLQEFRKDSEGNERLELFPITRDNLELAYELAKDEALKQTFLDLDLTPRRDTLEIAKKAAANPALKQVFIANPTAIDTDEGVAWAEQLAALPGMYANAAQRGAAPTREQMLKAAHVETGSTGAPVAAAPGSTQKDEVDEMVDAWNQGRDNLFGLPVSP